MMLRTLTIVGSALAALALAACGGEGELLGEAMQGIGGTGYNNVSPEAIDALSLSQSVTDAYGITNSGHGITDPYQLCIASTITSTGCTMSTQWENWVFDYQNQGQNAYAHAQMMKGIAKCSVEPTFTISTSNGTGQFPGQWPLFTSWKTGPLQGQPDHEYVSACILTLLNGNNESLQLCIIGPGGTPFSDACNNPSQFTVREGGYFGELFAATPSAYVVGPETAPVDVNGRDCYASQGTYCCDELQSPCNHHIFRAGAMDGTNSRCSSFAYTGPNNQYEYCTSFWTERETGRSYTHGFTTFIPAD
jgi:hypothetical protein